MRFKFLITACIAFFALNSCKNKNDANEFYNESNYQKVILPKDTLSEGVELYVHKIDTSYKLLKTYWDNGNVQIKSYVHNGQGNGKTFKYYENGNLLSEGTFTNGKKDGMFKIFRPNQKLSAIEYYSKGNPVGEWQSFDSSGKLEKVIRH